MVTVVALKVVTRVISASAAAAIVTALARRKMKTRHEMKT